MKFLSLCFILLSFTKVYANTTSCNEKFNLKDVYYDLSEQDQLFISNTFQDLSLTTDDLSLMEVDVNCTQSGVKGTFSVRENNLDEEQSLLLIKVGLGYLFPVNGGELSFKIGKKDLRTGKYKFSFSLNATTSFSYSKGSFQTFGLGFNYYLAKSGVYIGPIVQLLWINNPLLIGTQNFTFIAAGLQTGIEIPVRIGSRHIDFDLNGFAAIGGLDNNPKPFIYWGAGLRLNLPYRKGKK